MTLALLPEERQVVEAVLWFANLKRIRSTGEIEGRFMRLSLVPGVFQVIGAGEVEAYGNDQRELREWLSLLAGSLRGRNSIEEAVSRRLQETILSRLLIRNGKLQYRFALTGVQAACALGVALILDEYRGLGSRLKQCGNADCLRFNLDFEPRGRPRRFCSEKCKRAYDNQDAVERVRRFRRRRKRVDNGLY